MACDFVYYDGQIIRCGPHTLREEGVNLGSYEQDDGEVVEEKQENNRKTCRPSVVGQEMRHVEWEQYEVDL